MAKPYLILSRNVYYEIILFVLENDFNIHLCIVKYINFAKSYSSNKYSHIYLRDPSSLRRSVKPRTLRLD